MPNELLPVPVVRGRRFGDAPGVVRSALVGWLGG